MAPLYGLSETDVKRLSALLRAFEGGRLDTLTPQKAGRPGTPIETYLAYTLETIPPFASISSIPSGLVDLVGLEGASLISHVPSLTAYNVHASAVDVDTVVLLSRDPYSGQYFVGGSGGGTATNDTGLARTISTISAASGATPGSGQANMVTFNGTTYDEEGRITVYNHTGSSISSNKYIEIFLEPVSGEWFAGPSGTSPTTCASFWSSDAGLTATITGDCACFVGTFSLTYGAGPPFPSYYTNYSCGGATYHVGMYCSSGIVALDLGCNGSAMQLPNPQPDVYRTSPPHVEWNNTVLTNGTPTVPCCNVGDVLTVVIE